MDFRPQVGEKIVIDQSFVFTPHPAAQEFPYGQSGRRGTVYQIRLEADGSLHAIKVFTESFQDPRNAASAERLYNYASLPGLQACYRKVVIPYQYPELVRQYPQLQYAVLMPWVEGETWYDIIIGAEPLAFGQSRLLAQNFVYCLAEMEKRQIAHCDLSGANILIRPENCTVALVDVEELYSPALKSPDPKKLPAGTPGYAHKTAAAGLWSRDADRFAGAVLLAEMLCWFQPAVRKLACEGMYFDENEVQTSCQRFQLLMEVLRKDWGNPLADAFARAWFSQRLADCPSFQEWAALLGAVRAEEIALPAAAAVQKTPPQPNNENDLTRLPPAAPPPAARAASRSPRAVLPNPPLPGNEIDLTRLPPPAITRGGSHPKQAAPFQAAAPSRVYQAPRKALSARIRDLSSQVRYSKFGKRTSAFFHSRLGLVAIGLLLILFLTSAVAVGDFLRIPRGEGSLEGSVVGIVDKTEILKSIPAARVRLESKNPAWVWNVETDPAGRFAIPNLPAMQAELTVEHAAFSPLKMAVNIQGKGQTPVKTELKNLTGAIIYGMVSDSSGNNAGIAAADVRMTCTYTKQAGSCDSSQKTSATGEFKFFLAGPANDVEITISNQYDSTTPPKFNIAAGKMILLNSSLSTK